MAASEKDIEETMKLVSVNAAHLLKSSPDVKAILLTDKSSSDHARHESPDATRLKAGGQKTVARPLQSPSGSSQPLPVKQNAHVVGSAKSAAVRVNTGNLPVSRPSPSGLLSYPEPVSSSVQVSKTVGEQQQTGLPSLSVSMLKNKFSVSAHQKAPSDKKPAGTAQQLSAQQTLICTDNAESSERESSTIAPTDSAFFSDHSDSDVKGEQITVSQSSHVPQDVAKLLKSSDCCQLKADENSSATRCTSNVCSSVTLLELKGDQNSDKLSDKLHHITAEKSNNPSNQRLTSNETCEVSTASELDSSVNKPAESETVCETNKLVRTEPANDKSCAISTASELDSSVNKPAESEAVGETNKLVRTEPANDKLCAVSTASEQDSSVNKPAESATVCETNKPVRTESAGDKICAVSTASKQDSSVNKPAESKNVSESIKSVKTEPEKPVLPAELVKSEATSTVAVMRAISLRRKGSAIVSFTTEDFDLFHSELDFPDTQ
jgi:hypothetical protein